jgi:threonylcarbamoyladenosine tRNA methylthiotransferase MtaB
LFENENKNGFIHGFTQNYVKIAYLFDEKLANKLINVKTVSITEEGTVIANLDICSVENA